MEEWRPIPDYPYEVSDAGRVRRVGRVNRYEDGRIVQPKAPRKGRILYHVVSLSNQDGPRKFFVHRLVALAFHGDPPSPAHVVAHNDGNPQNNSASNIRWATQAENLSDRDRHGTMQRGEQRPDAKLTEGQVATIRSRAASGERHRLIAADYNVSRELVSMIARGDRWAHSIGGTDGK